MKTKKILIIATMLLGCHGAMIAQNENEIKVTTNEGEEDIMEVPAGMMLEVDSLLNLYNSKTYLQPGDCNYRDFNPDFPRETFI